MAKKKEEEAHTIRRSVVRNIAIACIGSYWYSCCYPPLGYWRHSNYDWKQN